MLPHQMRMMQSRAKYIYYKGGIRSGKTYGGALKMLSIPQDSVAIIAAPSYENIRNGALRTLLALIDNIQKRSGMTILAGEPRLSPPYNVRLIGGREFVFFSEGNFNLVRGLEASMCWIDEAGHMGEFIDGMNTLWSVALGRLNRHPGQIILTSSPNYRHPWSSKIFQDNAGDPQYQTINASTLDNFYLSEEYKISLRKNYTSEMYAQEVMGQDINPAGALFQRHWFGVVDSAPQNLKWFRYWDLAASTKTSADYTASVRVASHDGILYIADGIHIKAEWPDAKKTIIQTMRTEKDTSHGIEEALHGLAAVQDLRRDPLLNGIAFQGIRVDRDKVSRAMPWAARAESGGVRIVNGQWVRGFLDEIVAFPSGSHDDYVDAVSGAVMMSAKPRFNWGWAQ
jgi:predicted phage terminase large subunit-like protein